jgi:predicted kinase
MLKVIVMTGLPGSGKSTYFQKEMYPEFERISQDVLGSRDKCISEASLLLDSGHNVVIDRVNHTKKQRSFWIDLAQKHGASLMSLFLVVAPEECIARIHSRKNHETIKEDMSLEKKRLIVYNFHKELEPPSLDEGFVTIIQTRN